MQLADDDMRSRVIASGLLRFWYHLYLLDSSISIISLLSIDRAAVHTKLKFRNWRSKVPANTGPHRHHRIQPRCNHRGIIEWAPRLHVCVVETMLTLPYCSARSSAPEWDPESPPT